MKSLLASLAFVAGCAATTHPRYAPELERRWPDCVRVVVIPGSIHTEVKNYKAGDWFTEDEVGKHYGQLLAQSVGRVLRDEAEREPRPGAEAATVLGGDEALARSTADRMLAHAREWMARDPGYSSPALSGLAADPGVVPDELRRHFDAIVVLGGRTRYESDEERTARYGDVFLRNGVGYPLLILSPLFPPLLPISIGTLAEGLTGYWVGAPNISYFSIAVFDARTGRLLFSNDWFDTEKVVEPEDFTKVARDMLRTLVRVKGSETAPLGERPDRWEP